MIHLETGHLLLNVSLQLLVGISLEMVHGTKRVMPLYVLGVGFNWKESYKMCVCIRFSLDPLPSSALTVGL